MLNPLVAAVSVLSLARVALSSGERPVLSTTTLGWVVLKALANDCSDDFRLVMLC